MERHGQMGRSGAETLMLKNSAERIMGTVLESARTNIAPVALRSTAQELLRLTSRPDPVICGESGRWFEVEQAIAMPMSGVKAVILIGDPDQLPPTVISAGQTNELSQYLQRSLISRLRDVEYPLMQLRTNYRCHTATLNIFNREGYRQLRAGPGNDQLEQVENVSSGLTESRLPTKQSHGCRSLFVHTVEGVAETNDVSFRNLNQVTILRPFLLSLYKSWLHLGEDETTYDELIITP